ncbi:hypothetical protein [Treponema primitia]|uniref:hypothetical protein n=1 Tax=Treponema primitia TaxID=88058 RepID=UPI00145CE39E|nr:hypothetical protein [Treponema primitia]
MGTKPHGAIPGRLKPTSAGGILRRCASPDTTGPRLFRMVLRIPGPSSPTRRTSAFIPTSHYPQRSGGVLPPPRRMVASPHASMRTVIHTGSYSNALTGAAASPV